MIAVGHQLAEKQNLLVYGPCITVRFDTFPGVEEFVAVIVGDRIPDQSLVAL